MRQHHLDPYDCLPSELASMPTLAVGQADDLKYDNGRIRVWLSRCGEGISRERLVDGRWEIIQ